MVLTQQEIDACRDAFDRFDKDNSGAIDVWELKSTLAELGQAPSEEELFQMISQVDDDGSGGITFSSFLKLIEIQKTRLKAEDDESDTIDAFVAMGGNPDKTGEIATDKLRKTIKQFELTIDIDQLIAETDTDGSGFIDYEEFKTMLSEKVGKDQ
eukprot:tig00001164_g7410.t1